LKPEGKVHLKTDSPDLYQFTKTVIDLYNLPLHNDIDNVYQQEKLSPELAIKTHYEKLDIAKSNSIFYLCFSLPEIIENKDDELAQLLKKM
jgi:tRNA (guanine-N7-)-methyltransferase